MGILLNIFTIMGFFGNSVKKKKKHRALTHSFTASLLPAGREAPFSQTFFSGQPFFSGRTDDSGESTAADDSKAIGGCDFTGKKHSSISSIF